jgi:curved DNA-binding protein CbpA
MTKKYYEILEVSETATQKEIKKAYQKLSLKWHPDRQNGKSLEEKKQANEKMQEINKAYEILGDEEKRKRYDLGDTDFTFSSGYNYSYEEELGNINDELKRLREEQKILARKDVINMVGFEMLITEIFPRKLDSSL